VRAQKICITCKWESKVRRAQPPFEATREQKHIIIKWPERKERSRNITGAVLMVFVSVAIVAKSIRIDESSYAR
jgi:hypothetical protein